MTTTDALIDRFIDCGEAAGHEHERPPWDLVTDCVNHGQDNWAGLGLLSLFVVRARWGVDPDPDYIKPRVHRRLPTDPAGVDWVGVRAKSGGHLISGTLEHPWGGLSVPHCDSSFMRGLFYQFEYLATMKGQACKALGAGRSWNQLLNAHRIVLLGWGTSLLMNDDRTVNREVASWIVKRWLEKYWEPAVKWDTESDFVMKSTDKAFPGVVTTWALNSRIANSASGVARRVRGLSFDEQAAEYRTYQRTKYRVRLRKRCLREGRQPTPDELAETKKKGDRAAKRAERSVHYAKRVGVLFDAAWIAPVSD